MDIRDEAQSRSSTPTRRARVLLAEDDEGMRALVREALLRSGYEVVEARDGAVLLKMIEVARRGETPFDLIISDVKMPGASGLTALQALRANDPFTPLVLMTAYPDEDLRDDARQLGADCLFEKPFPVRSLIHYATGVRPPFFLP